jgi:GNAT superfamily N-acetyltransferase
VDWKEGVFTYSFWTFIVVAILGTVFWVSRRARWMTRTNSLHTERMRESGGIRSSAESVRVRRVRSIDDLPHIKNQATVNFEPFLTHMIEKTLAADGRVALATTMFDDLVGVGLYNREAKVGTIFAKSTEVTETLRKYLGAKDFFSEHKHRITVRSNYYMSTSDKQKLASVDNAAFNVFETHKVYKLSGIPPTTYDPSLVRPMTDGDIGDVIALAKTVYKAPSKKWIRAALECGDLGYVAEVNGRIVGFGFACVCGDDGRLHTLGVHPDHRGKGIAKELHRARLEAMRRLGVTTVIDEIADWNLASIRISTLSGFSPVGKMWVETVRTSRVKKNIVRR